MGATPSVTELVQRFYAELWNVWDDAGVEAVLAEDFRFRGTFGTETVGRDGWRRYRDMVRRAAPDFRNEVVDLLADGDRAAARLWYTGTHRGPLLDLPPTGRVFGYSGAGFFQARSGRLDQAWVLGDVDGLRGQLS